MPKNSYDQIEQDEKKIIVELSKNANKSINDIAKSLDFSRQKVWRIVKKLEEENTIWGYTAIIDKQKLGQKTYILLIKRSNKPMEEEILSKMSNKEFTKRIEKLGIQSLFQLFIHGYFDWLVMFNASDIKKAKGYVEELNRAYQGFIEEISLHEMMFPALYCGMINPEIEKVKDFFKV